MHKGTNPDIDSYSAFWDNNKMSQTSLSAQMKERKVTDLYVCGLAYDFCVGATANHSLEHGYRTILVDDASRGISVEQITETRNTLAGQNAVVVHSSQVCTNFKINFFLCITKSNCFVGQRYGGGSRSKSRIGLL